MTILKGLVAAFSMYSRIPMPHIGLDEQDMKYALPCIPVVGVITGIVEYCIYLGGSYANLSVFVKAVLILLVPMVITGGFHIDGFLDVADAVSSYQPREKKLEILKDPQIGSFAVIRIAVAGLFALAGAYLTAGDTAAVIVLSAVFVIARVFTAITSILFPKAKPDGMLANETKDVSKGAVVFLYLMLSMALFFCFFVNFAYALAIAVSFTVFTLYYRHLVMKEFGGVTGDTAGYFVVVSEVLAIDVLAIMCYVRSLSVIPFL